MRTRYAKQTFITVPNRFTLQSVSGHAQLVFMWLCDMQDENGYAFPSYNTLAEMTGFSRNTVIKATKELEGAGLIGVTPRYKDNERSSNLYEIYIVDTSPYRGGGSAGDALPSAGDALGVVQEVDTEPNPIEPNPITTTKVVVAGGPATHTRSLEDLELDQGNESGVVKKSTREYGNADINAAMAYFEERLRLDPKSRWARARAKNLISKYGLDVVKQAIDIAAIAQEDQYGPKVSNMEKLFYKWNDLVLYARKKEGEINGTPNIINL